MSSELYNIWRTMLPLVKEVKPETWRILMTYPWKDSRNFKVVTTNRGGGASVAKWLAHLPFTSKVAGSNLNEDFSL